MGSKETQVEKKNPPPVNNPFRLTFVKKIIQGFQNPNQGL